MSERISLVLVPVNRSPAADAATCHAALLARLLQASLQLVHVMPLNPAELSDLPANRQTEADHDRAQRLKVAADAFAHARRLIGDDFEPPLREVSLEEEGFVRHPGRTIAAYANRQSNCLLVIGARHLSDLGKFIEGSVSDEVVHKANCPVTVVHPEAAPRDIARIGRVVLPVDGSRHSDEAALLAGDLARSAEAPVDLLFCRPLTPGSGDTEAQVEEARRVLDQARQRLGPVEAGIREQVLDGDDYAEAIVGHAHDQAPYPVIVMGRRGLGAWREKLMGSVSHRVIDLAHCPVTVVV
ncbi:universal stress protein [Halomonas sp. E14]|uniref:universal stress protein n=1 Tax=Halomonas sp. E14 TaxID=3397245 RepID=UPI00403E833C